VAHVTKETSWCTIDVDTTKGRIVVVERWQYVWKLGTPRMTRWTIEERRAFHARADRAIWNAWSNRAMLAVDGTSEFAKRFSKRDIPVFMDIRWVIAKLHWTVQVTKVDKTTFLTSRVGWSVRQIELDTNDFREREICFGPPKDICAAQIPVAHEFGHTLGNIGRVHKGRSDEYDAKSLFSEDVASMMHRGNELRDRHFNHLLNELRGMVPDAEFSLNRLQ
jgi:hypothetical protein